MEYKILDIESVKEFLFDLRELRELLEVNTLDELHSSEIGDGNLNFVFIVSNKNDQSKSVIVKQAVPYLRCVGEEFPLSRERMTYEIRALLKYQEICSEYVPKIYYSSEAMSIVVMQNLSNHIILRKGLIQDIVYPNFVDHITTFLANSLFYTSSLSLDSKSKREMELYFNSNTELCKLTEDFVFTAPYIEDETNNINEELDTEAKEFFKSNDQFKKNVLELKYLFMNSCDALLHGDLHTGSIMANTQETYVIDPEFAFVGPFGFDVGALVANLINSYISHCVVSNNEEYKLWLLDTIKEFYTKFEGKFLSLWKQQKESALLREGFLCDKVLDQYQKEFIKDIFTTSIGFAGCKITRRVFGVAGVEEIRGLDDSEKRKEAELKALALGQELVNNYKNIENIEQLIEIIKKG